MFNPGNRVIEDEHQLLPGIHLLPASGHWDGLQIVVIETGAPNNRWNRWVHHAGLMRRWELKNPERLS